jgi:hypothetical protein
LFNQLITKIIEVHGVKVDYNAVAASWRKCPTPRIPLILINISLAVRSGEDKPTARAISKHIQKVKKAISSSLPSTDVSAVAKTATSAAKKRTLSEDTVHDGAPDASPKKPKANSDAQYR